ncbi:hypothetical protein LguiA_028156 [Lonicera macranthoides]
MALLSKESGSTYCRKQKSLGLLCSNFLSLYNHDYVETVLTRKAKNLYSWKGFGAVPGALQELKKEGLTENYHVFDGNIRAKVSDEDEDEQLTNPNKAQNDKLNPSIGLKFSASSKNDNRKEKSLGLLTQSFIKLFLCSNMDMISLDEAAKILLGEARNAALMRTKVRRLYDIANVLSSMNFIEKINHPETRKHAFRWLGMGQKLQSGSYIETRKRTFGTELNTSFKRSKVASPADVSREQLMETQLQRQIKCENYNNEVDKSNLEQGLRYDLKNNEFGPFAPVNVSVSEFGYYDSKKESQVCDWESLTSNHRPQYQNQGMIYASESNLTL